MTSERPDDGLEGRLRDALRAEVLVPDQATWARMEEALAELATPVGAGGPRGVARRPRAGWRASALALSLASALTASAAAAAVATNTLPGPLRSIAYHLGLPVTSPGLYQAQQETTQLRASLHAHQRARVKSIGESLATHLRTLDATDRATIQATADGLLAEAGVDAPGQGVGTTTTTSTVRSREGGASSGEGAGGGSGDGSSTSSPQGATTSTLLPVITLPGIDGSVGDD